MANRTHIVCLHEGEKGRSIDPVFINALIKTLKPNWIRPFKGSNLVRPVDCGGRKQLIARTPTELKSCLAQGGKTTLMVWADVDADPDCEALKYEFWKTAEAEGMDKEQFEQIVFIFAKYRLENWIQYLTDGQTDEDTKGPRVKHNRTVAVAAKKLGQRCLQMQADPTLPPSLKWSCKNWRQLVERMKDD